MFRRILRTLTAEMTRAASDGRITWAEAGAILATLIPIILDKDEEENADRNSL